MENIGIPYKDTGFFSKLITDYLDQSKSLSGFYNRFPTLDNFEDQIKEKSNSFSSDSRNILVKSLNHQYKNFELSTATQTNINSLAKATTYTITTGHQLNLFSGPLYFLYKIISVLKLCKQLKEKYPKQNFVPIYWMASEDHDFEEIKYFNFKGKKIAWDRESGGPCRKIIYKWFGYGF